MSELLLGRRLKGQWINHHALFSSAMVTSNILGGVLSIILDPGERNQEAGSPDLVMGWAYTFQL